jgi:hypothetical protein
VSSDIVSGVDKDKASEIAHGIHEISLATVIGNVTGSPEIDVEDIEGTAERPGKDKFAVAGNGTVGSDAVRALEYPVGYIFAAVRPKEP